MNTLLGEPIHHFSVTHKVVSQPIDTASTDPHIDFLRFELHLHHDDTRTISTGQYVGCIEVQRIPSGYNMQNIRTMKDGYDMGQFMKNSGYTRYADSLKLYGSFRYSGCRKHLKRNDLYVMSAVQVVEHYRQQGVAQYMLTQLPLWVSRVTRETHPVFAVAPGCHWTYHMPHVQAERTAKYTRLLERCGWRFTHKRSTVMFAD